MLEEFCQVQKRIIGDWTRTHACTCARTHKHIKGKGKATVPIPVIVQSFKSLEKFSPTSSLPIHLPHIFLHYIEGGGLPRRISSFRIGSVNYQNYYHLGGKKYLGNQSRSGTSIQQFTPLQL